MSEGPPVAGGGLAMTTKKARPRVLSVGDLVIDLAKDEVRRNGRSVQLTPMEFDLLAFLAARRGKVISRQVLLKRVWGYEHPGLTRTVDAHICCLRRKLQDEACSPTYIETVRGKGYRIR